MNIETVAANLRNTIAGKEILLATYKNPSVNPYPKGVKEVMAAQLEINISELNKILQDVEQCLPKPVMVKEKIDYAKAIAMGREDYAHSECPDDCSKCEHFKVCVYPIMD